VSAAREVWIAVAVLGVALIAGAASAADPDPGWEFIVAPYGWGVTLNGTIETDDAEADIDVGFSDIVDALDAGFLFAFEARRARVNLTTNAIYLRVSDDADGVRGSLIPLAPPGSFDVGFTTEVVILEGLAGYEVFSAPVFGNDRRAALDLRLGARYWYAGQDISVTLRPGVPLPPFHRSVDDSSDWVDALVGARIRAPLSERFGLIVGADYGGFGWGSSSDPTWGVQAFANYALGERWNLAVGWRHLELDRGPLELRISGPLIGATYRF
jgi:hypothetical protein